MNRMPAFAQPAVAGVERFRCCGGARALHRLKARATPTLQSANACPADGADRHDPR